MTIVLRALICLVACCACGLPGSAAAGRSPSPSPTQPPVRAFTTCFTAPPAGWAGTQRASLPTTQLEVSAVTPSGDRAYGSYRTTAGEDGIAALDLTSGAMTRLVVFPAGAGGASALAVAPPWLAWVRVGSPVNPGDWTLEARDLDTGEQLTIATPRLPDGTDALGQPALAAVGGSRLAWAQPTSKGGQAPTAELRVYDLTARRQTVLDSGEVGPPALAGRYLVWSRAADGGGGQPGLRAVDATTLQPVDLPPPVRGQQPGGNLAGSPNYLVFSTDERHATAWRIDRDQLATYTIRSLDNRLQFLTVAGHFLIWFTSVQYAVLDLDTGGGYDVALPNSVFGSEAAIVRTASLGAPTTKGAGPGTAVSVLPASSAPAIPACTAG